MLMFVFLVLSDPKIVAALHLQHFMKAASQNNTAPSTHSAQMTHSQMAPLNLLTESHGLSNLSGYSQMARDRVPTLRL